MTPRLLYCTVPFLEQNLGLEGSFSGFVFPVFLLNVHRTKNIRKDRRESQETRKQSSLKAHTVKYAATMPTKLSTQIAQSAKLAFDQYQSISADCKIEALESLRSILQERQEEVLLANALDLEVSNYRHHTISKSIKRYACPPLELSSVFLSFRRKTVSDGQLMEFFPLLVSMYLARLDVRQTAREQAIKGNGTESMLKRLDLRSSPEKYDNMLKGIEDVIKLEDPVGKVQSIKQIDEDLELYKVTCPIGVLLIIFEARPEVIVNITALAIKSGLSSPIVYLIFLLSARLTATTSFISN